MTLKNVNFVSTRFRSVNNKCTVVQLELDFNKIVN